MYEYKVIAAPTRGIKAKGVRSAEARFSYALEKTMNDLAAVGWEFQRAETLPSVERSGLTSTTTTWRNVLVFRRSLAVPEEPENTEDEAPPQDEPNSNDIDPEDIPTVLREEPPLQGTADEAVDIEEKLRDQAWKDRTPW